MVAEWERPLPSPYSFTSMLDQSLVGALLLQLLHVLMLYAGQKASFDVEVLGIQKAFVPEWDDALADSEQAGMTVQQLEEDVRYLLLLVYRSHAMLTALLL